MVSARAGLIGLGTVAIAVAAACGLTLQGIGFPDGHRTDLDLFHETLLPIVIGIAAMVAVVGLGVAALGSPRARRRCLQILVGVAVVSTAGSLVAEQHARATLDDGRGG